MMKKRVGKLDRPIKVEGRKRAGAQKESLKWAATEAKENL